MTKLPKLSAVKGDMKIVTTEGRIVEVQPKPKNPLRIVHADDEWRVYGLTGRMNVMPFMWGFLWSPGWLPRMPYYYTSLQHHAEKFARENNLTIEEEKPS